MGGMALGCVFNHCEACEAAAGGQAIALRAAGQKQSAEGHPQVIGLGDLEQGQEALAASCRNRSGSHNFLAQGKHSRLAGHQHHAGAVGATEPPGPLYPAIVKCRLNPVSGERLAHHALQTFHSNPQFLTSEERDDEPSFRGIFHSLTCQLSSLPREEFSELLYRERGNGHHRTTNPPKNGDTLIIWPDGAKVIST